MNDERPIEKLLRRAARKRNDEVGVPPELHPANRRLLQSEVARQFPKPEATKQSALAEFWAGLTQRWVYAVGLFVILGVVAITLWPSLSKSKPQTQLAQSALNEDRLSLEIAKDAPATIAPLAAPAIAMEPENVRNLSPSGGGNLMTRPETVAAPTPAPAPTTRFDRQTPGRRTAQEPTEMLADAVASSGASQPPAPIRVESQTRQKVADESGGGLSRTAVTDVAQEAQQNRSNDATASRTGSGGGNLGYLLAGAGLKPEEKEVTHGLGTDQKDLDSLGIGTGAASAVGPGGVAPEGFADKTWLARGGGAERERAVLNSQAYSNMVREQAQAYKKEAQALPDRMPVLANFKIEQAGRDVRVVDGDGSIYTGVVDEQNTLYKQLVERQNQKLSAAYENKFKLQAPKAAASTPAKQQVTDYYLYRVEGTNRTLNQNVVFTWNFVPTNEALAAAQINYQEVLQKTDATKLPSQFPGLLRNSFINGRAQFGEGKQVEVNAVPVQP